MLRRPTSLLALLLGVALVLGGCSSSLLSDISSTSVPSQAPVQVTGAAGEPPVLDYDQPYDVVQSGARTVWPGAGDEITDDEPVLLNMYAQDGRDGSVISSTFNDSPAWYTMSVDSLGSNLYDSLRGQHVGARLLLVEEDDGVPVILVVDVLPTRASGTETKPVDGLPTVHRDAGGKPYVAVPKKTKPPEELKVQPLVRGTGPQVKVGQMVTMRFTAVRWSDGKVFDTTWSDGARPESATIGIGGLVEGLDEGLLEQAVGSQVLLVVPPSLGYGGTSSDLSDETLVYVVDILDSHFQVTDEGAGDIDGDGDKDQAPEKEQPPDERAPKDQGSSDQADAG